MGAEILVQVSEEHADRLRLDDLSRQLRGELLEADGTEAVDPLTAGEAPPGTRSGLATVAGALLVTVQPHLGAVVRVVSLLKEWLARSDGGRSIRLEVDGDVIELTGASTELQEKLVAEWIARRARE
jgi:hypothetical protein